MKIDFEFETPHGVFRDALHFEDNLFSDVEVEAMKQERLANWITLVTSPPVEEPAEFIEIDGVKYAKVA